MSLIGSREGDDRGNLSTAKRPRGTASECNVGDWQITLVKFTFVCKVNYPTDG